MKKVISILMVAVMLGAIVAYSLLGVDFSDTAGYEVLKIYNWEEYISEGEDDETGENVDVISLFEEYCEEELGRKVKVEYSTFGTNENMYNELNLSKKQIGSKVSYSYDLVCPSEYMLLKMMREGMLEPYDKEGGERYSSVPNYAENASQYIIDLFSNLSVTGNDGTDYYLADYASCYMWGTMGFVINPELVDEDDASSWSLLWKDDYKGKGTIKDSVRDSYIMAVGYVYGEELAKISAAYQDGEITADEYNDKLTEIFNRTDDESVKLSGEVLTELKDKIYGYEVDSGKKEMAQGKISINFAWSGDAAYTIEVAAEEDLELIYVVPEEGSNIFFDGWAMPKGANKELAQLFINFIARPEIAQLNMNYIGYTSAIASDVMFENAVDWYGYTKEDVIFDDESGSYFAEDEDGELFEVFPVDLGYFFTNLEEYDNAVLYTDDVQGQFYAQYPDFDTVARCTVMKCFTDDETKNLNDMWETAKIGKTNDLTLLLVVLIAALVIAAAIVLINLYKKGVIFQPKAPKGYVLTKIN